MYVCRSRSFETKMVCDSVYVSGLSLIETLRRRVFRETLAGIGKRAAIYRGPAEITLLAYSAYPG